MENKELYKLFQLSDLFVSKYGYTQVMIKEYEYLMKDEAWLLNKNAKEYKVIRLTFSSASQYEYETNRIEQYLKYFKTIIKNEEIKILDIHINSDIYNKDNEPNDYLNIDENYYDGIDIQALFPEITNCIHHVENQEKEIMEIVKRMTRKFKNNVKKQSLLNRNKYYVTYIVIALCILNYLISLYLKYKYDDLSSVFVFLGADYKTFTLGLKQFYRLITYAFVHNDIIHLSCNLFSLWNIGRFIEAKLGHRNYCLILLFSIISGSLTQGILSDNSICIGLSGGIYGLLVVFIIEIYKLGAMDYRALGLTVFLNLFLNFLSTTAWMCHLGGAIAGFVIYYCLLDLKKKPRIILCIIFILSLIFKYITINSIESIYAGTDLNVLKILNDLGLNKYANNLLNKLMNVYSKYGG